MAFKILTDGDAGLSAPVMENFRHVNFGANLLPVNSTGVSVDDTLDLGSSTKRWKKSYFIDDMVVNTNAFFVDATNKRIGIGIAVPTSNIHISSLGASDKPDIKIVSDGASGVVFVGGTSATGTHAGVSDFDMYGLIGAGNSNFVISNNDAVPIVFGTDDTERMSILGNGNITIENNLQVKGDVLDVNGNKLVIDSIATEQVLLSNFTTNTFINSNFTKAAADKILRVHITLEYNPAGADTKDATINIGGGSITRTMKGIVSDVSGAVGFTDWFDISGLSDGSINVTVTATGVTTGMTGTCAVFRNAF